MLYSSKVLAFILAIAIAGSTALILMWIGGISTELLLTSLVISFVISFVLCFVVTDFLLRDIHRVSSLLDSLQQKEFKQVAFKKFPIKGPIQKINEEIYSFADQKQKEIEELKKLEAFRRDFIANISHELKTPIFAAQGFVHTLLDGAMNDKTVRAKFLKKAAKSLDGLDVLVQDLLTLSHIETRQIKMQFENIDLYRIAQEVFEQLEKKAGKRNIQLRIEGESQKVIVFADGQRIFQVLTNLISNAITHSRGKGEVIVSFEKDKKSVTTHVRDFGKGIAPEHLSRIFERFYRVDKSRSREKGGTGLGLAIVKHILEYHNSKAVVNSTYGEGSDFSFSLPRTKASRYEVLSTDQTIL